MTIEEKIEFCKNLAYRTFMAFNGRINPINKSARLIFDFVNDTELLGKTNKLYTVIYPFNFIYTDDIHALELDVVDTVLHELSHLDQDIDIKRYKSDQVYYNMIERSNELHTILYIINNIDMINSILGTNIDTYTLQQMNYINIDQSELLDCKYQSIGYERVYLDRLLDNLSPKQYLIDNVISRSNIIINISRKDNPFIKYFIIKYEGEYNKDTFTFNNFIIDYFTDHTYKRYNIDYTVNTETDVCVIDVLMKECHTNPIIKEK